MVDQDALLDVVDSFALALSYGRYSRMSVSRNFEAFEEEARPYVDAYVIEAVSNTTLHGQFVINIDADGNGTLDLNSEEEPARFLPMLTGIRTHSGDSVSWTGELMTSSEDSAHMETVTNTVSEEAGNTRRFVQAVTGRNSGTFDIRWESNADLSAIPLEGTDQCKAVSGTFTETRTHNDTASLEFVTEVLTVSRANDDLYWRVTSVGNGSETIEYLARELEILEDPDNDDSAFFLCDLVDFR